jgi:hypothetical protein
VSRSRRILLAAAVSLWLGTGWAQDDACTQKCSDSMGSCVSGCSLDNRCSTSCAKRLNTCIGKCSKRQSPLGKKCFDAAGKAIPCPNFTPPPPPKEIPPDPEER